MILKSTPFAFFLCIACACASDTLDGFPTEEPINHKKREAEQRDLQDARDENERLTKQVRSLEIRANTLANMNAVLEATKGNLQKQLLTLMDERRQINAILNPTPIAGIVEQVADTYQRQVWRDEENLLALQLSNKKN